MKAISLWQPYASLVGIKEIETRSWYTKYRGPLAIHATAHTPGGYRAYAFYEPFKEAFIKMGLLNRKSKDRSIELPEGAIVYTCKMVECTLIKTDGLYKVPDGMPVMGPKSFTEFYAPLPSEPERSFGDYTPGRFAWTLKDIKRLPKPIPVRGHQGLWEWEPPEGVILP